MDDLLCKPISFDNIDEFVVYYDKYETSQENENRLSTLTRFSDFQPMSLHNIHVDELLIWRSINSGKNVLISGKAGAGKSNLLSRFVSNLGNIPYALCAPTGIAAYNIGGETLHRKLSLGLAEDSPTHLFDMIKKNQRKYARTWKFLTTNKILIIDEYSMVSPDFFNKLDYLFRKARDCNQPFGGICMILVGDLTQLGPIIQRNIPTTERYVVDTESWARMQLNRLFLNRSYRQIEGDPYLDVLNEVRFGYLSEKSEELLKSRIGIDISVKTETTDYVIEPIDLFPYKVQVDRCNQEHMNALLKKNPNVKIRDFHPALDVVPREHVDVDPKDIENGNIMITKGVKQLEDMLPVFHLKLAEGAQVMMRCNKYIDQGICNGSVGIVTNVGDNTISVLFMIRGKFSELPLEVSRFPFTVRAGKTADVRAVQFPLSLAWGSTIHKCQGLTLDKVRIDARNCFDAGQLYVALSRVRKIDDLSLIGFNPQSVICDKRAVEFETLAPREKAAKRQKV